MPRCILPILVLFLLLAASSAHAFGAADLFGFPGFQNSLPMSPEDFARSVPAQEAPRTDEDARPREAVEEPLPPLEPFGANLFSGSFSSTYYDEMNPGYTINSGDRILLNIWGAFTFNEVLIVDPAGMLFLPTVGPIPVEGVTNANLVRTLKTALSQVYTDNIDVYATLLNAQPMAIYVTGFVASPGRYAGGYSDSVLFFLDQAGGIDPLRGSYRQIQVLRHNKVIGTCDLYPFIRQGILPDIRLQQGDVIFVPRRGIAISAQGEARHNAVFEFSDSLVAGEDFLAIVDILPGTSHVRISGHRLAKPFSQYMTLDRFRTFELTDGDEVVFVPDVPPSTINVFVEGALDGESSFILDRGASLRQLLDYIAVDEATAGTDSIYLRRPSVALQQKEAIELSLYKLEQSVLTDSSNTVEEAYLRAKEAELVSAFVQRARMMEPDGAVVVSANQMVGDIALEDNDVVVIPERSDVVLISGEIQIPHAVVFDPEYDVDDYVDAAGGFTERADDDTILIMRRNRQICFSDDVDIMPGDQILVLPYYDSKDFQLFRDIVDVIFKVAVSTGAILRVID